MAQNYGPKTVTSGLVLSVDAADRNSYIGSGSLWGDLSGNGKNGALVGGSFYSGNNGGVINFDGVNDTVSFGTGNTFFPLTSFTIDINFQSKGTVPTTGTVPGLFGFTFGIWAIFNSANSIRFGVSSGSVSFVNPVTYTHTTNIRDDGSWNNVVFQATPTDIHIYLNGELKASRNAIWSGSTVWPNNGWTLGRDNNNVNNFFTGSIASYKMYNRALTASEILQNYEALKARFI